MKCGLYSFNTTFRKSISDKDIDGFEHAKQHFSDCYLMTTLETLSHTDAGREVLKEQIQYDDNNPDLINCYLYNKNGEKEKYTVPSKTALEGYEKVYKKQPNEIIRAMDISVDQFEKKHKAKPFVCKLADTFSDYTFEKNSPSFFMKTLTGVEPRVIAEKDFNLDLTSYKEQVMQLFELMDKDKKHSFLIGTGLKMLDGRTWHVYILENVDLKNNTVTVKEKRSNQPRTMSIDAALSSFKYIVGYFDKDLKKTKTGFPQ